MGEGKDTLKEYVRGNEATTPKRTLTVLKPSDRRMQKRVSCFEQG